VAQRSEVPVFVHSAHAVHFGVAHQNFFVVQLLHPEYHQTGSAERAAVMFDSYRCPFCQKSVDIDLANELDRGQTDLRGSIDDRQNLKLDLPKRLLVTCTHCGRQFVIQP
jgi:hypothetical protein